MAVNEHFPTLMPTSYLGSMATDPKPYASLDAMWKAFSDLAHSKTPAVNGEIFFSQPVSSSGARSSALSGPRRAGHGRGQGRVPSQSPSRQTGSIHNPIVMCINDPTDPWLDHTSNCWPLEEHHYAEVFAVSASFKADHPPSGAAFSRHPPAPLPSGKTGGIASTLTKTPTLSEIVGNHSLMFVFSFLF